MIGFTKKDVSRSLIEFEKLPTYNDSKYILGSEKMIKILHKSDFKILRSLLLPMNYHLLNNGEIIYTGITYNIFSRIRAHNLTKNFNEIVMLVHNDLRPDLKEMIYINRFQPELNKIGSQKYVHPRKVRLTPRNIEIKSEFIELIKSGENIKSAQIILSAKYGFSGISSIYRITNQ